MTPQRWLPEAYVRVLRYQGSERGSGARQRLLEDVRVEGSIPRQLTEAHRVVLDLLPARRALVAGRFERLSLISEDAWLEGIVNAVVHRWSLPSYNISGAHIRVEIFDDRVEIGRQGRDREPRAVSRSRRPGPNARHHPVRPQPTDHAGLLRPEVRSRAR